MRSEMPRLRPLDLGDLLDTVFRLYRSNFLTFIGVVALVQVPMIVLNIGATMVFGQSAMLETERLVDVLHTFNPASDSWGSLPIWNLTLFLVVSLVLGLFQGVVVQQVINGALAHAISERYHERPVSLLGAYSFGGGRMLSLVAAALLVSLIIGALVVVVSTVLVGGFALLAMLVASESARMGIALSLLMGMVVLVGFMVLALAVVALVVLFLFVTQVVVLEGRGPVEALRRSVALVRGSFWRVAGIWLLMYVLVWILTLIPSTVLGGVIGFIFNHPVHDFVPRQSLTTLVGYLAQIVVLPPLLASYTLLYYDLRVRKEGYDLELRSLEEGV
jgi:MFS family permease